MSDYKVPPYLARKGDSLIFNKDKQQFIFYVPEKYYDTNNAVTVGEYVQVFGLLDFQIVDMSGKPITKIKRFSFPTIITTKPATSEKVKDIKLTKYAKSQDYRLLKYNKGDQVITSVMIPQDISTVEAFYGLFNRANLPPTIPYDQMTDIYLENMALSGNKYNINAQLFGILYSEVYRAYSDTDKPYRLGNSDDTLAYTAIPITQVPKKVSPYVSITSENWDESIIGAVGIKDGGMDSPLEPVLTGDK